VQLFVARARAVRSTFALDAATAPVVASICRQLDGIPLAIELAAARVKVLPVTEIADRLADRFTFLTSGPRPGEARHRTLGATLDWSYQLLSDTEKALLRRLAVFSGGWTIDAAEHVCSSAGIDPDEVLDLLFRLVDRSLVVPDPDTGRFRLLVMIRDYGRVKLREAGEADAVRNRHLTYFTAFAQQHGSLTRSGGAGWTMMRREHDNLRTAVDFALDRARRTGRPEDVDAGFRLANAMVWFWQYNLRYEGVEALTALLALPTGSTVCRALALQGLALFHVYYPTPESRAAARESLALLEETGDVRSAAISRLLIAWEGQYGGDTERSWALVEQAEQVLAQDGEPGTVGLLHYVKATLHLGRGAFDESIAEWLLGLEQIRAVQDTVLESAMLSHMAIALRETGRVEEAIGAFRQAIALDERAGALHGLTFALVHLAHTALSFGADTDVPGLLDRGNDVACRAQNPRCQAWAAWGRARLALAAEHVGLAFTECRHATMLLQDREFPWAIAQLYEFLAETADADGRPATAEEARDRARELRVTSS
jgi:tetratricopeptide (TPR) repeat protein